MAKTDLYEGLDYATAGEKALDAKAGLTLQNGLTELNSKVVSFEEAKSAMVSSALGMALGLTSESTLEELTNVITAVQDRTTTIHTAIVGGSTGDSNNSYYRINGNWVEVCPAKGYWGWSAWDKSAIRISMPAVARTVYLGQISGNGSLTASSYTGYTKGHFLLHPTKVSVSLTAGIGGNGVNIQKYSFSLSPSFSYNSSTGVITTSGCYTNTWIGTANSGKDAKYIKITLVCSVYFVG